MTLISWVTLTQLYIHGVLHLVLGHHVPLDNDDDYFLFCHDLHWIRHKKLS